MWIPWGGLGGAGGDGSGPPLHVSVAPRSAHSWATSASRPAANPLSSKALLYWGDWGSEDDVTALPGQRDSPVCVARLGQWCLAPTEGSRGGNCIPGLGEGVWWARRYAGEHGPGL